MKTEVATPRGAYNKPRKCRFCNNLTKLNEKTGRYSTICDSPECSEKARAEYVSRMTKKFGTANLMKLPEWQVRMAEGKAIPYKWSDGTVKYCLSNNEVVTCRFLDKIKFRSEDVRVGEKIINYKYKGKNHIHILDIYIESIDFGISVKDGTENPNTRPSVISDRAKNYAQYEHIRQYETMSFVQIEGDASHQVILDALLFMKRHNYKKRVVIEPTIEKTFIESSLPFKVLYPVTVTKIYRDGIFESMTFSKSMTEKVSYSINEGMMVERINKEDDIIEGKYFLSTSEIHSADFKSVTEMYRYLESNHTYMIPIDNIIRHNFSDIGFANIVEGYIGDDIGF